jgi:cyclase
MQYRGWLLAMIVTALSAGQPSPDLTIKKEVLADGVYLFRAPSGLDAWTATNVVAVVNDRDVTVFDSNTRPATTRMVIAEIKKVTDKPVRTLINSHWHMDHWSGNAEYAKAFPAIQIIATSECRDYMTRMGPRFFEQEALSSMRPAVAAFDSAKKTGKQGDGSPFTAEMRKNEEQAIQRAYAFAHEMATVPRVLPTLAYRDTLVLWSGGREFRLFSETGDATGSTVMYLRKEKILVTGDVLIAPEDGVGPPPWTTNSYAVTPWLNSLRSLAALDIDVIVPGQGPAMHDKRYLTLTIDLFSSAIDQVHAALQRGSVTLADVLGAVDVDSLGARFTPGVTKPSSGVWLDWRTGFITKAYEEAVDGIRVDR